MSLDYAQTLPGIFSQKADARVKGRTAPDFQGIKAKFIKRLQNGKHFLRRHAGRDGGLLAITKVTGHKAYRT